MQTKALANNSHQHINGDGDPDLRFDRILGGAIEGLDPEMLLDPFEEQFDLPSGLVQLSDGQSRFAEVVCQEHELLARRWIGVSDAPQGGGVTLMRVEAFQDNCLIETDAETLLDRLGITALEPEVVFGSGDKEGAVAMDTVKSLEVQVCPVHDVERSGFDGQFVEDVDVVNLAGGNNDKGWNVSMKVQQRMQFDRCFALSEFCPGKQRQAKIDRRGIQGVGGLLQFDSKIVVGIQDGRLLDQNMSEIGEDTPIAFFVGIGQGAFGPLTANPSMIELASHGPQTCFDVAQTFPIGELSKCHHQELLVTSQRFDVMVSLISAYAFVEFVSRQPLHHLSENNLSFVHNSFPPVVSRGKYHTKAIWN